ncbi:hypothetical protein EXIGLDRAFT_728598 [Exidia glandulosa HHB12029]|uniref:Thioesterase/thiol ester dehydrase-isomerase n=1 Tax=Exidia glandulosa HHB12029 TaxID=1314781 RepID=A0A165Q4P5_EXIGL|nr:hypothetical protein EXIGLDRAFT_728598 [Exidia glandulosa HHB12029]
MLALGVLLLHYRSWPGYWHLRVFKPLITLRIRALLFLTYIRLCTLLIRAARALRLPGIPSRPTPPILSLGIPGAKQQFIASIAQKALSEEEGPMSASVVQRWKGWAGLDDCDWNWHLSNSAYAKNFDYARTDFLASFLAPFLADGGAPALGSTEFYFLKEVPIAKRYEIEVRIGGWDDKWLYVYGRYVSRKTAAERRKEKGKAKATDTATPATPTPRERVVPFLNFKPVTASASTASATPIQVKGLGDVKDLSASFTTAADDTDVQSVQSMASVSSASTVELALDEAAALSASSASDVRSPHHRAGTDDDQAEWTVHAIGMASYAFKTRYSRRSVPPALVLAACGFGSGSGPTPTPWDRMQRMRFGGAPDDAQKFWAGGWAEGEAWWDEVAQKWEAGRVRGMAQVQRRA